jgi:integrase
MAARNNLAFTSRMSTTLVEAQARREVERNLRNIGPSESVERFLNSYGKVRVRATYGAHLSRYFDWLRQKGASLNPDELIRDNLRCIYRSEPEDVALKRRHRAWLEEYVNVHLGDLSSSYRRVAASVVKGFYDRNDSPFYGKLSIAEGSPDAPARALKADDIRKVLLSLPVQVRTPLLMEWQSGVEVNRILSLRWGMVLEGLARGDCPLKLEFFGRKRHRRGYHTYLGRDSVKHLGIWKAAWIETTGREPTQEDIIFLGKRQSGMDFGWLNDQLKRAATRLSKQGEVENADMRSWHTHMLRHSFKSEAEHAKVPSGIVEYMMGHNGGIGWVYDNRDQVHPEDFVNAYRKLEPFVSLDYSEIAMRDEFDEERKSWITEIASLRKEVARLAGSSSQAPQAAAASQADRPSEL